MPLKNEDYWRNRFKTLEASANKEAAEYAAVLEKQYKITASKIEKDIAYWYQRFADNNEMSLVEAKRFLSTRELAEFKWDVKEYIKRGEENAVDQRWMKELENASARVHISRLESLNTQMRQHLETLYEGFGQGMDKLARNIYAEQYYHTAYEIQKGFNVGYSLHSFDAKQLDKVLATPWTTDNKTFSDRIWTQKEEMINKLQTGLTQAVVRGDKPEKAIKDLVQTFKVSESSAGRLVMTESAFFSSCGQKDCFNELGVEKFEIVATLDSHTSNICQDMDGKICDMGLYEPGVTAPPFHPWCRSTTVPYFEDNLGERAARDKDGKIYYVDNKLKYPEWKEKFVDSGLKDGLKNTSNNGIINNNWKGINYSSSYTKKEAIRHLKKNYGITFHDSKKYPIDEVLLNDCVGWLDSFSNEYNEFMNINPCKLPCIENLVADKMKGSIGKYTYYQNNTKIIGISLNAGYHSNIEVFQEYVDKCVASMWYPQNATIHKTFIHEYGHHVSNSLRWIENNADWQHSFLNDCINEFNEKTGLNIKNCGELANHVSRYGATKESELFAEAFAEYFGGENPRTFAQIFGQKLNKLLKELSK